MPFTAHVSLWLVSFLTLRERYLNLRQMPHDAFISYSTSDKAAADAACATLEASGIRCWIAPRDITPGAEWGEAIVDAINHCRVMILIFSESANESPQIPREVERAVSKGIPVIPLRIQDIAPARSLEYFIGTVHWLDALTPPLEVHLRRLVESVKTLLLIDPTPPAHRVAVERRGGSRAFVDFPGAVYPCDDSADFLRIGRDGDWDLVA